MEYNESKLKTIGSFCKTKRKEHNVTMSDIADKSGCSIELVSHFESGRTNNLQVFLTYLDMDIITIKDIEVLCDD